jgi:hypothetical protein
MGIEDIREKIMSWDDFLTTKQKKNIHFFSMRNFVFHYDHIPDEKIKEKVIFLLSEYVNEMEDSSFEYKGIDSYELTNRYMNKISEIYTTYLGFKSFLKFRFVLIFGILGDGLLYIFLHNEINIYFPIIFLLL